LINFT